MFNKIKMLSMTACAVFLLQSCHSGDDALFDTTTPVQVVRIDDAVFAGLRTVSPVPTLGDEGVTQEQVDAAEEAAENTESINSLFGLAATIAGRPDQGLGTEPCKVKLNKLSYETIGGKGEATTSTGVAMVPYSDEPDSFCNDPRPVVLYAHGTSADRDYDLSKIISNPSNPANSEGMVMLALYAAEGYVVVAPNYAGYADSALSYHPYADEVQQSTEMINALENVRAHASTMGANLSSELFITGMSQGGYVAMATHKALQAKNQTVTASLSNSGPYAMGVFLDTVMSGTVNGGATTFAPMYLTALEKAHDIYTDESEVYAIESVENSLPAPGAEDAEAAGLPVALFSSETQTVSAETGEFPNGYGSPFLLKESFRTDYVTAITDTTATSVASEVRRLAHEADLRDWVPTSPVVMCGVNYDPVVFYAANTSVMAAYWDNENGAAPTDMVTTVDLASGPAFPYHVSQGGWEIAALEMKPKDIHSATAAFCAGVGLTKFNTLL